MGRVKALLPHPDGSGRTLVRATAETLLAAGIAPLVVVLGHARQEIAPELRGLGEAARTVPNPAYRSGMLSSLQTGIRETAEEEDASWALVAPVDQPFLSPGLIGRLQARARRPGPETPLAVAPTTPEMERAGVWGLPVLLSRRLFPEILAENPDRAEDADQGARGVLLRYAARTVVIPAAPRELATMETPVDHERMRLRYPSNER